MVRPSKTDIFGFSATLGAPPVAIYAFFDSGADTPLTRTLFLLPPSLPLLLSRSSVAWATSSRSARLNFLSLSALSLEALSTTLSASLSTHRCSLARSTIGIVIAQADERGQAFIVKPDN